MNSKTIACPDCPKKFFDLKGLNNHIIKTGCNHFEKMHYSFEVSNVKLVSD